MDVDDLYDFHNKYDVRDDGSPGMWDNSSSSEGDRFQMDLARIQNQPNLGEQKMIDYLQKELKITEQQAKAEIDFNKDKQTLAPQLLKKRLIQDKSETTYIIACHGGSAESYGAPPLDMFNVDDINFNTLVDDGSCLLMARNKWEGYGSIQKWINETNQGICHGFSKLYPQKGNYNDRYLRGDDQEFNSGIYKCGSDIPIINFDVPSFKINYAQRFLGPGKMGKPMVSPPMGIYKLSDIIAMIKSYHLKSPEKSNRIKIVGAFCCGGFPNQGEVLAGIMEDLSVRDTSANFKYLMDTVHLDYDDPHEFMNTMKAKGKTTQAKKNKKGEKKGTSKKSGKKGTSKKSGKKGTLGVAKKQGIGKQKASKAKKSKKIKKVKSKKKSKK